VTDRAELEAWIVATQRRQRRLKTALIPALAVAIGVTVWSRPLGALTFVSIGIVAVFGFWILSSHIADWRGRIDALDRPPPEKTASGRVRRQRD
jgi:hypothetical protein